MVHLPRPVGIDYLAKCPGADQLLLFSLQMLTEEMFIIYINALPDASSHLIDIRELFEV